jgi:hypothetical protein
MQRIARQQKLFGCRQGLGGKAEGRNRLMISIISFIRRNEVDIRHLHIIDQPVKVDGTSPGSGRQTVAAQIVKAVGVKGAGNDGMVDVFRENSL